jgi:hypothetical protein
MMFGRMPGLRFIMVLAPLVMSLFVLSGCYESRLSSDSDGGAVDTGVTGPLDARVVNPQPDIGRFDRSCDRDDDCVVVFSGSVCGCGCEMSAVNIDEEEAYRQHAAELAALCEGDRLDCIGCPDRGVVCDDGICEAAEICPPGEEC